MNIYDLADVLRKKIEIIRYPNQQGRFSAKFENCEISEHSCLISAYGNGKSPDEALNDYTRIVSGKTLVFDGITNKETRFGAPELELIREV